MRPICTFSVAIITLALGAAAFPLSVAACPRATSEVEETYTASRHVAADHQRSPASQIAARAQTSWLEPRRYTSVEIGAIRVVERMR